MRKRTKSISTAWWRSTETPLWALALGGVGLAILTAVLTTGSGYILEGWKGSRDHRNEQVRELVDSMREFQTFASAFSLEMLENGKVASETKFNLQKNISEQFGKIRAIEPHIKTNDRALVEAYKENLIGMRHSIDKASDIVAMKEFWNSASKLTVNKNQLNHKLQKSL